MLPRTENALLRYFEPIRTAAVIPSSAVDTASSSTDPFNRALIHPEKREKSEGENAPQDSPDFERFVPVQKVEVKPEEVMPRPVAPTLDEFPGLTVALLELYENLRAHARRQARDRADAAYRKQEQALQDQNKLPKGAMLDRKVA